jgi:hypothetical protein
MTFHLTFPQSNATFLHFFHSSTQYFFYNVFQPTKEHPPPSLRWDEGSKTMECINIYSIPILYVLNTRHIYYMYCLCSHCCNLK